MAYLGRDVRVMLGISQSRFNGTDLEKVRSERLVEGEYRKNYLGQWIYEESALPKIADYFGIQKYKNITDTNNLPGNIIQKLMVQRGRGAKYASPKTKERVSVRSNASYVIYALIDPENMQVRYIGQTRNIDGRIDGHNSVDATHDNNSRKIQWIENLKSKDLTPMFAILEKTQYSCAYDREAHWILYYKAKGADLLNNYIAKKYLKEVI